MPISEPPTEPGRSGNSPALILVGTDFRRADLDLRDRVAFSPEEIPDALVHLLARAEIAEACLLSTCNRTEIYVHPRDEEAAYQAVVELIFKRRAPEIHRQGRLYVHWHEEAAVHLLSVASGLESMILGEPEILGQVKQAAAAAEAVGASSTVLRQLLRSAVVAGRRARQETSVAAGAVSFGYGVVELARSIFSNLESTRVLVLGAGEMALQVARNLRERGAGRLTVTNRSRGRAENLREQLGNIAVVPFEERGDALSAADLVVVSTGADEPVVTHPMMRQAMARRPGRPLLMVDLGVPRNVEPEVRKLENLFLHDIDSMKALVERNLERRREEIPRVERIIEEELQHFRQWHRSLEAEPLVAELQRKAELLRIQEVESARQHFPAETHAQLDRLTRSLVRKLLHHPSTRLRRDEQAPGHLELVRELFQLGEDDDD
ncbi:MAG: glutamyl-tRNA reductase [Acidobacteriota bacterium]|nr:glutamyl-tRNA reductase [Acidobacteriota bacterium]